MWLKNATEVIMCDFLNATDWVYVPPQNSYVKILSLTLKALRGGAFEGGVLVSGVSAPLKDSPESSLAFFPWCEGRVRRWPFAPGKRVLTSH